MSTPDTTPDTGDQEIYDGYSVDDEDQLTPQDTLDDADVVDELERGYSPPERYSVGQGYGNTAWEQEHGESLDQRLKQEIPDPDPRADVDVDVEVLDDGEVGEARAGRLVDPGEGNGADTENEMLGTDVGIDGAAASAEEAAMHVVEDR